MKSAGTQGRLDGFFKILPKSNDSIKKGNAKTNARKGEVGGKSKKKKSEAK